MIIDSLNSKHVSMFLPVPQFHFLREVGCFSDPVHLLIILAQKIKNRTYCFSIMQCCKLISGTRYLCPSLRT